MASKTIGSEQEKPDVIMACAASAIKERLTLDREVAVERPVDALIRHVLRGGKYCDALDGAVDGVVDPVADILECDLVEESDGLPTEDCLVDESSGDERYISNRDLSTMTTAVGSDAMDSSSRISGGRSFRSISSKMWEG
jgi:hypothetical protein